MISPEVAKRRKLEQRSEFPLENHEKQKLCHKSEGSDTGLEGVSALGWPVFCGPSAPFRSVPVDTCNSVVQQRRERPRFSKGAQVYTRSS